MLATSRLRLREVAYGSAMREKSRAKLCNEFVAAFLADAHSECVARFGTIPSQGRANGALAHSPPMFDIMDDVIAQTNLARSRGKPARVEPFHFDGEKSLPINCPASSRFRALQRLQQLHKAPQRNLIRAPRKAVLKLAQAKAVQKGGPVFDEIGGTPQRPQ